MKYQNVLSEKFTNLLNNIKIAFNTNYNNLINQIDYKIKQFPNK